MTSSVEVDREPVWGASIIGSPWPVSHGRLRAGAAVAARIIVYALLAYALSRIVPEPTRGLVGPILVIVPLAQLPAFHFASRRVLRRIMSVESVPLLVDSPILRPYGIRALNVIHQPGARRTGLCFQTTRRTWIVMNPYTPDHGLMGFVLAHEIGHALRKDRIRRLISYATCDGLFCGGLVSFDYRIVIAVTAAAIVLWTAPAWASEIACDRIAVRKIGLAGFETFVETHRALLRRRPNRTVRRRIRRVIGLLTHPPIGWRLALQRYASSRA